jgi:hypothetical protein
MRTNLPKQYYRIWAIIGEGRVFEMAPEQQNYVSLHEPQRAFGKKDVKND